MHKNKHLSTFLFSDPSFVEGTARILDFGDTLSENAYNASSTPQAADDRSLRADWEAVGQDLWGAIEQMRGEIEAIKNPVKA